MGIIASNAYLSLFSAGTLVGATSTYFLIKFRNRLKSDEIPCEEKFEVRNCCFGRRLDCCRLFFCSLPIPKTSTD